MSMAEDEPVTNMGLRGNMNFDAFHAEMRGFMSSVALQRQPGGHALAMPCWTIVPPRYHAPPPYEFSKQVIDSKEDETGKYPAHDYCGGFWKVTPDELGRHSTAMQNVQKQMLEGFAAMELQRYYEAVSSFDAALSELLECHRDRPLQLWVKIHRGHALLRAALLESPLIHGQSTSHLLDESHSTLKSCILTLSHWVVYNTTYGVKPPLHAFNRSLLFSGLVGLAWISFFRGRMEEAEHRVKEAQAVELERSHLRSDRDIDTVFLQVALQRFKGDLQAFDHWMGKFGHKISDFDEDIFLVTAGDYEYLQLQGNYSDCVEMTVQTALHEGNLQCPKFMPDTKDDVKHFVCQLEAGYAGNTWVALGASREARAAYKCAEKSKSLLMQAAALVGLGNVHMRLSMLDHGKGSKSLSQMKINHGSLGGSQLKYEEAREHYMKALEIYNDLGYKEGQRIVQCNLGNLYHKRKDLQQALEWYKKAAIYFSGTLHRSTTALLLHLKFAEVFLEMESWEAAWDTLKIAEKIPQGSERVATASVQHLIGTYFLKMGLAKERMKQGGKTEIAEAKNHFSIAVQHYGEIQASDRQYSPLWIATLERQKETYELLLWCLTWQREHNSAVEALVWCERSRSRVSMVDKWHTFASVLDHLSAEVARVLKATASSKFYSLPFQESWNNLKFLLSKCALPTATVVEYVLCADFGLLVFVLDLPRGNPKMVRVSFEEVALEDGNLDREKLTALVTSTISELLPNPHRSQEAEKNLAFLYKLLIKPVEKWLKKPKQIIIIPHEVLFRVPFHALIDGEQRYLIQRCPISCAESLRSLLQCSLLWDRQRLVKDLDLLDGNQWRRWLVVGINAHKVAKKLYYAEAEAKEVADTLSKSLESSQIATPFLGSRATKDEVCKHLQNAVIVHFATHGIITEKYEQGGILFSDVDGKAAGAVGLEPAYIDDQLEENGTVTRSIENFTEAVRWYEETSKDLADGIVLSADEIVNMKLHARLVVLSACQTASGVILGEGVAGLGRALLQAGVPSTVLSLWPVSDTSTRELMKDFYRLLVDGRSVADAMQSAMTTMIAALGKYSGKSRYNVGQWAAFLPFGLPSVQIVNRPLQLQPDCSTSVRDLLKPLPLPLLVLSAVTMTFLKLSGRKS
ncbi:unnamed protein product [Calypogeia fissa]